MNAPTISPLLWKRRPPHLCQLLGNWKGHADKGDWIEQKHDGWRFNWIRGQALTRNGMPFRGIGHIERALHVLERQFGQPMFFDAEYVVGTGIDTLAQTKAHQDRGWRDGDAGTLWLFDCLPMTDWEFAESDTPLSERWEALRGSFGGMMAAPEAWEMGWTDGTPCPLRLVEHSTVESEFSVMLAAKEIWARGGEGVVVKKPSSPYRRTRNESWLKLRLDIEKRGK